MTKTIARVILATILLLGVSSILGLPVSLLSWKFWTISAATWACAASIVREVTED